MPDDPRMHELAMLQTLHDIRQELRHIRAGVFENSRGLRRSVSYRNAFMRGIVQGFGTVVGATVVVSLFVYLLSMVDYIPVVGEWVHMVVEEVQKKR